MSSVKLNVILVTALVNALNNALNAWLNAWVLALQLLKTVWEAEVKVDTLLHNAVMRSSRWGQVLQHAEKLRFHGLKVDAHTASALTGKCWQSSTRLLKALITTKLRCSVVNLNILIAEPSPWQRPLQLLLEMGVLKLERSVPQRLLCI